MEFYIPLLPSDLLSYTSDNKYTIENNSITLENIEIDIDEQLENIELSLNDNACNIIEHANFDKLYYYSLYINSIKEYQSKICTMIDNNFKNILLSVNSIILSKNNNSEDGEEDVDSLLLYRNCIKMYTYLLSLIIDNMERQNSLKEDVIMPTKKKGAKKVIKTSAFNWDSYKALPLSLLSTLTTAGVWGLWPLATPEEDFGSLLFKTCMNVVEGENFSKFEEKVSVFTVLVEVIKKFQLYIRASTSFLNMLMNSEEIASTLGEFMKYCVDHECGKLLDDILRDISKLSSNDLEKDRGGAKSISTFLFTLASLTPRNVYHSLPLIINQLENDSYNMRNGVLMMLGQLIIPNKDDSFLKPEAIDNLLSVLVDRIHDVNAFTRGTALKVWISLCEARSIPIKRFHEVVSLAIDRLNDKSSIVRKVAIGLLCSLLKHNPFHGDFSSVNFHLEHEKLETELKALQNATMAAEIMKSEKLLSQLSMDKKGEESDSEVLEIDEKEEVVYLTEVDKLQLEQKKKQYIFLHAAVLFLNQLESALPVLLKLLASSTNSDVEESIDFFILAAVFKVPTVQKGVENILHLIWSKETAIKQKVSTAYSDIYVGETPSRNKSQFFFDVALRLVSIAQNANLAVLTSLEELMYVWLSPPKKSDEKEKAFVQVLDNDVIEALWSMFTSKQYTSGQRRGALHLLGFIANSKPELIRSNVKHLVTFGLPSEEDLEIDLSLSRVACLALQKIEAVSDETLSSIMLSLEKIIFTPSTSQAWYGAAEQVINVIFKLNPRPDLIATDFLNRYTASMHQILTTEESSPVYLTKLFFMVGHIALKMLVHLEQLENKLKSMRALKEKQDEGKKKKEAEADELGMNGTDDYCIEILREKADVAILASTSLLGPYLNLITTVLTQPGKYSNETLQSSAVLAFCKCLCIHVDICEPNLPLLFTLLEKSSNFNTRSNLVIALGDIAFRFPNAMEPWTKHMYAPLKSNEHIKVRKNTLMVLTHLILNDMIKIKGEICEIAICMEDSNNQISDLAKLFFSELSKKGKNPIYNLLPDTLSRLSNDKNVTPTMFQNILWFLLQFIDKDKQTESLIEKLCVRLLAAEDVKSQRDFAYCLSQLSFSSERCVSKVMDIDCFKCYKDRLSDDEVFKYFETIIKQAKKVTGKSGELKTQVDEWEVKLIELHEAQNQDSLVASRAQNRVGDAALVDASEFKIEEVVPEVLAPIEEPSKVSRGKKVAAKAKAPAKKSVRTLKKKVDSSDDDEVELMDDEENDNINIQSSRTVVKSAPTRAVRSARSRV